MDEFKKATVDLLINKLFAEKHFSICTLDKIIESAGVIPNHEVYRDLRALHCVNYADMPPVILNNLQGKVIECLQGHAMMNPARVLEAVTDEGNDFAFTEDRYLHQLK